MIFFRFLITPVSFTQISISRLQIYGLCFLNPALRQCTLSYIPKTCEKVKVMTLQVRLFLSPIIEQELFQVVPSCRTKYKCQCCPYIETSQLICTANQLTGFYMRATLARNVLRSNIFRSSFFQIQYIQIYYFDLLLRYYHFYIQLLFGPINLSSNKLQV